MIRQRKTLTTEDAEKYTKGLLNQAKAIGIPLENWVLGVGKENDVRDGSGQRRAIVDCAQTWAAKGVRYGLVLDMTVTTGSTWSYKIQHKDLAGFVCANGYCTISPPDRTP